MINAMLFDLDGTLVDSAPDGVAALNYVRSTVGLPPLAVEEAGHAITRGAPGLLSVGMPETDEKTFESWRLQLLEHYYASGFPFSSLYEGVEEVLEALEAADKPWGIVTNKVEYLTHAYLKVAGLASRVSSVVCGDTLEERKPHPEPVLLACEQMGITPAEVLFVGDDLRDLEAGNAAGTQIAAVYYGYGSRDLKGPLLDSSTPIHKPLDLLSLLQ